MRIAGARRVVAPVHRIGQGALEQQSARKQSEDSASQQQSRCSHFAPRPHPLLPPTCSDSLLSLRLSVPYFLGTVYARRLIPADTTSSRPGCRLDMSPVLDLPSWNPITRHSRRSSTLPPLLLSLLNVIHPRRWNTNHTKIPGRRKNTLSPGLTRHAPLRNSVGHVAVRIPS